jgi:DNA (cytosine-5)-methyltransferase 1
VKAIIDAKRPAAFLLENVKHLQRHDGGTTIRIIMETLRDELRYFVPEPRILDARFVVPQHRERIFIVGFKTPREFHWPKLAQRSPRLEEILENSVPDKYTLSDHLWGYLRRYAEKHRARGNGFGYGLFGPKDVARTLSARYYKDGSEILIDQGKKNPRRLTPQECARLMGFKNNFIIPVSDTRAYKQFGNSVVVPLVEKVACEIVNALNRPPLRGDARRAALQTRPQLLIPFPGSKSRPRRNAGFVAP